MQRTLDVVVTGANRGIGLALTRQYLQRGDRVVATARDLDAATALRALTDGADGRLRCLPLDVRDDAACARLGESLRDMPIDVLINNAGVGRSAGDDAAAINVVFDTNAVGPLRVTRALVGNVRAQHGKIVLMTSQLASLTNTTSAGAYAYRMSKAALNMAGRNLALELATDGIAVVMLHPGWVKTDMGGPNAPVAVDVAVAQIIAFVDGMGVHESGRFYNAEGSELPW